MWPLTGADALISQRQPPQVGLNWRRRPWPCLYFLMTTPTLLSLATPCVLSPIATNTNYGPTFLEGIEQICASFNGLHLMRDLSNISFGLPERKFLNQTFMVMAIAKGLDHAIINPLSKKMMPNSIAAETLMGRDEFCPNYIKVYRSEQFEVWYLKGLRLACAIRKSKILCLRLSK